MGRVEGGDLFGCRFRGNPHEAWVMPSLDASVTCVMQPIRGFPAALGPWPLVTRQWLPFESESQYGCVSK